MPTLSHILPPRSLSVLGYIPYLPEVLALILILAWCDVAPGDCGEARIRELEGERAYVLSCSAPGFSSVAEDQGNGQKREKT